MENVDPVIQCAACGTKLKLRAATLKVLKQIRCVKCHKTLEIPAVLKNGGPIPEGPVIATPIDLATLPAVSTPIITSVLKPALVAAPAAVLTPVAATPVPVLTPVAAPVLTPVPVPTSAPVAAPAMVAVSAPVAAPAPVAAVVAIPVPPPAPITPFKNATNDTAAALGDSPLVSRIAVLETKVNALQGAIETLSAQIRKLVQLQAAAANACLAGLSK